MRSRVASTAVVGTLLATLTGVAGGSAQAAPGAAARHVGGQADGFAVVVRGLNNPRQISATPTGGLLVAEAGTAGSHCVPNGDQGQLCVGGSGAISLVPFPALSWPATPVRLVTGLPSVGGPGGVAASGPSSVSAGRLGEFYFGLSGLPPNAIPPDLDTSLAEQFVRVRVPGAPRPLANLLEFETVNDPDQQGPESNPYGMLALPDRVLIADAAGNDILSWRDGRLSVFAVLPNIQDGACAGRPNDNGTTGCDPVPTSLALGRDGSILVGGNGSLSPGAGRVYVLDGRTGQITREIPGLTSVNGLAVGPDGSVYASQLFTQFGATGPDFTTGVVTRIRPDGTRTDLPVPSPAGLAVVGHCLYVSAWSTSPAGGVGLPDSGGQVWRLRI